MRGKYLRYALLFMACFFIFPSFTFNAAGEIQVYPSKRVLILHSYHKGLAWTDGEENAIRKKLKEYPTLEIYTEYLDSKRRPLKELSRTFAEFLREKYAKIPPDVIICSDNNALTFLVEYRDTLFSKVPIVFCGVNNYRPEMIKGYEGEITGVIQEFDVLRMLDIITNLQPKLAKLVIVSGKSPTAQAIKKEVDKALRKFNAKDSIEILSWDKLTTEELIARLKTLTKNDAILLCNFNRDAAGKYYTHKQAAQLISSNSLAPVYAMEDHYLGAGVLGGYMNTAATQGRGAAKLALSILKGGTLPPVSELCPNVAIFDYYAMVAHGLDKSHLPPDAVLLNEPSTFYESYRRYLFSAFIVFMVLTISLFLVTFNAVRRRRSELDLEVTLDSIGDAVISTDKKGRVTRMNRVAGVLTGWSFEDAEGRSLRDVFNIVNADTREELENPIEKVLKSGGIVELEQHTMLMSKDGAEYLIDDSAAPIQYVDGKIIGVVLVFRDVTDECKTQMILEESQSRYRSLLSNALIGIMVAEVETRRIRFANPFICEMLGYSQEELLRMNADDLHPENDRAHVISEFVAQSKGVKQLALNIPFRRKDGKIAICDVSTNSAFVDGVECNIGVIADITDKRKAEDEILKMRKLRSLGTLAGGIAHDFNNILLGIFGNISLAKLELKADHPAMELLLESEKAMTRARNLTNQLLTFASGGAPVKESVAIAEVVEDIATFTLSGSNVKPIFDFAADLSPVDVDKGQFEQVVSNLIVNADQAMPDGGNLYITLENYEVSESSALSLAEGKYIKLTIKDEGAGIDSQHLEHIFDPYFTTKQAGKGLGLATVFSIVNRHNGVIGVTSEQGKGSTFTLYLPVSAQEPSVKTDKKPLLVDSSVEKARILIMDDETYVCEVTAKSLMKQGFTVDVVADGVQAIDRYMTSLKSDRPFDVVVMDLTIPAGMGGEEAVGKLLEKDPNARVIVFSGYSNDPIMADYERYGFKGRILKPFGIQELIDEISRVMSL